MKGKLTTVAMAYFDPVKKSKLREMWRLQPYDYAVEHRPGIGRFYLQAPQLNPKAIEILEKLSAMC